MLTFATPIPLCTSAKIGKNTCTLDRRLLAKPYTQASSSIVARSKQKDVPPAKKTVNELKKALMHQLEGVNRGLEITSDPETMTDMESEIEDTLEALEDNCASSIPTKDANMSGSWRLIYTSSSITRYFGGVTGLHRILPEGKVGEIVQSIDAENGKCNFVEKVGFRVPLAKNEVWVQIRAEGRIQSMSEVRQLWDAETVRCGFFRWFADNWKPLRAFQIADNTYLDGDVRITRGQTGSVNVYERVKL